jgi:hypothetical protein
MKNARRTGWAGAALALVCAAGVMLPAAVGAGTAPRESSAAQKGKNKKGTEETGVLVEDRGTLKIQLDGQPAGSEEFEIKESGGEWTARGTAEVVDEKGGSAKVTGKMTLAPDGALLRYEWTASSPRKEAGTVVFEGTVAKMERKLEGAAPFSQEFHFNAPPVVILDNNLLHHYEILARLYDWEHKEPKTYSVLIPQEGTPGTITAEYAGQQVVDERKLDVLRVRTTDLEIDLYCDPGRGERLVRLEVPSAKAVIFRQADKK